jgi:hypothetical protein
VFGFIESYIMNAGAAFFFTIAVSEGRSNMTSSSIVGALFNAPVVRRHTNLCTFYSLLRLIAQISKDVLDKPQTIV